MRSTTETLISAMRILANDIASHDGVANAAIAEAADRLEELQADNDALRDRVSVLESDRYDLCISLRAAGTERDDARHHERTAMHYLSGVRAIIGGSDFPDMVRRASVLHGAAADVVQRYDSPLWNSLPSTDEYIKRLRKALGDGGSK